MSTDELKPQDISVTHKVQHIQKLPIKKQNKKLIDYNDNSILNGYKMVGLDEKLNVGEFIMNKIFVLIR